ncbi:hypothetical protein JVU11DRAFT_3101 [Chiua virens]|nr:hypothetical protein JVU11DRAFT_3101 [Chiua virens]
MVTVTSPFHQSSPSRPSSITVTTPSHRPTTPFKSSHSDSSAGPHPDASIAEKLYVHDPFYLLPARRRRFDETAWGSRPDIIQTYNLNLSLPTLQDVQAARRKAEELEEFKSRTLIILRYKRTKKQIENCEPMIEVPLPPYPRRPTKVEESHLYISPAAKVGAGNHSVVYKAEWECYKENVEKEIKRLKDTELWDELMKVVARGLKGYTGRQPTNAELDEVNDLMNLAREGEIFEREVIYIVPPGTAPSQILNFLDEKGIWDILVKKKTNTTAFLDLTGDSNEGENSYVAHLRIYPPFSYESQKTCAHGFGPKPRTAMFTVVAKLSIEHDPHLAKEAQNYQQFPEHLFYHDNGYTILPQLHTIVPVNAVVPQFYGYYTPGPESTERGPYLSPILLLEHCGKPIEPEKLYGRPGRMCQFGAAFPACWMAP